MQKVSLAVSLAALCLMIGGLVDMSLSGVPFSVPGGSVLPVPALLRVSHAPVSWTAMSAGILLLALLPTVRVLLALVLYVRWRGTLNALAALTVLVELLMSMRAGG